jgi:exopolyphosphatase / guanosine-5'-triphosphate,3'-diphosphate pyrophosphatase
LSPQAQGGKVKPVDAAGPAGLQGYVLRGTLPKAAGAVPGANTTRPGTRGAAAGDPDGVLAGWQADEHIYAALDLGTNNCRLLIARPAPAGRGHDGFRVIDSFSRIVRLGEGLSKTGELGAAAVERTLGALEICKDKMRARRVTRSRLIATEACRSARNGAEFLNRVRTKLGLELEVVDRETEARLAAMGSASLVDSAAEGVVLFDIGGGSCELVWLARAARAGVQLAEVALSNRIRFWVSLKIGVVTLAEQFGGIEVSDTTFEAMINRALREIKDFAAMAGGERRCGLFHLLGTSGTVTTIAGVFLGLSRYDRRRVDGLWMSRGQVDHAVQRLRNMSYIERAANGCIGQDRADLVLAGCAILEAIRRAFPADRIRIADRGLRDGMLLQLMRAERGMPPGKN